MELADAPNLESNKPYVWVERIGEKEKERKDYFLFRLFFFFFKGLFRLFKVNEKERKEKENEDKNMSLPLLSLPPKLRKNKKKGKRF